MCGWKNRLTAFSIMLQNWRLSQSEALQEERANIFFIFISLWVFAEKAEWQQVHSVGDLQLTDTNSFCLQLNFSWEEPEVTAFLSIIAVHCHQSASEKQSGRGGWAEGRDVNQYAFCRFQFIPKQHAWILPHFQLILAFCTPAPTNPPTPVLQHNPPTAEEEASLSTFSAAGPDAARRITSGKSGVTQWAAGLTVDMPCDCFSGTIPGHHLSAGRRQ